MLCNLLHRLLTPSLHKPVGTPRHIILNVDPPRYMVDLSTGVVVKQAIGKTIGNTFRRIATYGNMCQELCRSRDV